MLPAELLVLVFRDLKLSDLLSVQLTCRLFCQVSDPLVYQHLSVSWLDLDALATGDYRSDYAHSIHIREVSASKEWSCAPKLAIVCRGCYLLRSIEVECEGGSSGWLRYLDPPLINIEFLKLTAHGQRTHIFDIDHIIVSFPKLLTLELNGFQLAQPTKSMDSLRVLRLHDCTWTFPTRIFHFGERLQSLKISLSSPAVQAFALSERFRLEGTDPQLSLDQFLLEVNGVIVYSESNRTSQSFIRN